MAFDGIVLRAVQNELYNNILGAKIDKINQPERDELIINLRNKGKNFKLLLSASSNNPRVYLTNISKENPKAPPMFCMLLRKYLQGGIIKNIYQLDLERVLVFEIDSMDEIGNLSTKKLIIEIMSKHSNIILVKKDNETIIDSIKRIPASTSSVRQVLPGLSYMYPPTQDKINPLQFDFNNFKNIVLKSFENKKENLKLFKFLYSNILGMSPLVAREVCYNAEIDSENQISDLFLKNTEETNNINIVKISDALNSLYTDIKNNNFSPTIIRDKDTRDTVAFSSIDLNQFIGFPKEKIDSISITLEKFFTERDSQDRIKQKSSDLRKNIASKLDRLINKISKLELELRESSKRDLYKIRGDLLTANIYKISRGDSEVELENFYSDNLEKIKIKLNPMLSPSENAQKYYKKYNKLKNASSLIKEQIETSKAEVDYLENIILSIDNSTEISEIDEIKDELIKERYIKNYNSKDRKKQNKKSSKNETKPLAFLSSDGFEIYVGKNNKQNDKLTLKIANKSDYWFHTKDIPGSHVIVKLDGKEISDTAIKEAALLAAYYSKGRMSSNVAIDYTERKNVKKPSGAKPGMVIYENNKTIYITPEKSKINNLTKIEY